MTMTQFMLLARYGIKGMYHFEFVGKSLALDKPSIVFANRLKQLEDDSSAIFPFEVKNRNVLKMFAWAIEKKDKDLIKKLIRLIPNFDDEIDTLMLSMLV